MDTVESNNIKLKLIDEIERISSQFIASFGLVHKKETHTLKDSLTRWMDFRYRYIEISKRMVLYSKKFPKKLCPDAHKGLKILTDKINSGEDINPYLSKTVWMNDTSSKKAKFRTDALWADFGITHFHLTDKPIESGEYFAPRSDWLLLCLAFSDTICYIDIKKHDEVNLYTNPEILQVIADSFPSYMERFELKGITGLNIEDELDANAVSSLRKAAVNSCYTINGKVYRAPGGGFVSAGLPLNVVWQANKIHNTIISVVDELLDQSTEMGSYLKKAGILQPDVELVLYDGKMGLYEKKSKAMYKLTDGGTSSILDSFAPAWAINRVLGINEP